MAMTYATVTGRIVIPGTTTGIPGELRAAPLTDGGVLAFPAEDYTTVGPAVANVTGDGTIEQAEGVPGLQIPTDVPAGTLWRLTFVPKGKGNLPVRLGDYEISASADIADLVAVNPTVITPTMAAKIEEGVAALSGEDTAVAFLVEDPDSETHTALSATYATVANTYNKAEVDAAVESAASGGAPLVYGALTMPTGFPTLPTTFYRDNDGVIRHGFDRSTYYASPVGTTNIYVATTGNDTTGNGSQATPYRTLQKAMTDVAAGGGTRYNVIVVDVPYFNRDEAGFSGTLTGKTVSIRSQHTERTLVTSSSTYAWTADGAGTYKATRSGVTGVADSGQPDHNNLPVAMKVVASVAACQAEAGTYYTDGATVWVHRRDGAIPVNTADTVVTIGTTAFDPILAGGSKLYVENLTFLGYVGGNGLRVRGSDTSTTDEFVAYNCGFVGNTGNGYTTDRVAKTYLFNCQTGYQDKDGFNYSYFPMTRAHVRANCLAVEYNCTAYELGINNPGAGSNNASTAHSAANVLRIGHVGYRNAGVTIHDVNGCRSVLYDCHVRTPVVAGVPGDGTCYSFTADNATDVGEAWLINCSAADADTALVVGSNTTVTLSKFQTELPISNGGTLNYV